MVNEVTETINIPYFKSYATDLVTYQIRLSSDQMIKVQTAIAEICLYGETNYIPADKVEKMYFEKLHVDLKASIKTYKANVKNGKKGGRPITQTVTHNKPMGSKWLNPNDNPNSNPNDNHTITITKPIARTKTKTKTSNSIVEIINHLNDTCSTNYKSSTDKTRSLINARLKDGFTVDDFKIVIEKQFNNWSNDGEFSKFLRPETLFGNKFEGYLNAKSDVDRKQSLKDLWSEEGDIINVV